MYSKNEVGLKIFQQWVRYVNKIKTEKEGKLINIREKITFAFLGFFFTFLTIYIFQHWIQAGNLLLLERFVQIVVVRVPGQWFGHLVLLLFNLLLLLRNLLQSAQQRRYNKVANKLVGTNGEKGRNMRPNKEIVWAVAEGVEPTKNAACDKKFASRQIHSPSSPLVVLLHLLVFSSPFLDFLQFLFVQVAFFARFSVAINGGRIFSGLFVR